MVRKTPNNIRRNSRRVLLFSGDTWLEKDERGDHKVYRAKAKTTRGPRKIKRSGNIYDVVVKIYGKPRRDGVIKPQNRAWVHCSCPYFLYYNEVALAARGSSDVMTSNGALPNIRNPRMKPYLCKHLFAATRIAPKAKAVKRPVEKLTDAEIDEMLNLAAPYIPGANIPEPARLGLRTRTPRDAPRIAIRPAPQGGPRARGSAQTLLREAMRSLRN